MSGEKLKESLKQASSTEGINRENIIDILKEILAKKYPHAYEGWKKSEYGELSVNHLFSFQDEPVKELEKDEPDIDERYEEGYEEKYKEGELGFDPFNPEEIIRWETIEPERDGFDNLSPSQFELINEVAENILSDSDNDQLPELQNENTGDEFSLLYMAAFYEMFELVEILLEAGADPNTPDNNRRTDLHRAVENGHKEVARILLEKGANVNYADIYGNTPLHYAAQHGNEGIIKILSAAGADNALENIEGKTPISLAKDDETKQFLKDAENRPLSKPIYGKKFLGGVQASTAEYLDVFEERSSASTTKSPLECEFRERSDNNTYLTNIKVEELCKAQTGGKTRH